CGVEELAMQHYEQEERGRWKGIHCEGSPLRFLFSLLFWDVIFSSDVPDAFLTPFQDAPIDLDFHPFFYKRREALILARIADLELWSDQQLLLELRERWQQSFGTLCRGASWGSCSLSFLQLVALCLGGRRISAICRALCINYRHFSGGMPDLVLLRGRRRQRGGEGGGGGGEWED
ncbi:hypothetical protein GUITHDRAFT_45708, partial [Guillardia theta CCMP2712]